ncbi:MAG: HlyD family efflux transporter periplasmic adaptor subunit [Gammaproteobacteria bacterium]|nr:HlyD family efflux transporter periplasmic adaptor subunit [Gammaproteobacteria bacterium]
MSSPDANARWEKRLQQVARLLEQAGNRLGRSTAFILHWSWRIACGTWRVLRPGFVAAGKPLAALPPVAKANEKVVTPCRAYVSRHVEAWRTAWEEEKRQTPVAAPKGRELEFLPAVLEVQETPASPLGRTIARTIMWLFGLALLWALIGKIDIVAIAQGKIVPNDRSKVIQPLENGVIKAIHVRDGQRVKQGDLLIELDAGAGSDRSRLENEHLAAKVEVARLRALLLGKSNFDAPVEADPAFVQIQRNQLRDQLSELQALTAKAEAFKKLLDKQMVSRMQYLEAEQARAAKAQEHAGSLSAAETRVHSLSQELAKAGTRASQQHLTASIDGVVQQLAVHTVGGVVTPAQQLMVIAPIEGGSLEIEAFVENKDIGFVEENQPAEIKVESFPFTRYGIIEGKVLALSKDAVPLDKVGYVYSARVAMAKSSIRVENDKDVILTPGMTVTVEIKTGSRRIIEYFLSPLLKGAQESIRER